MKERTESKIHYTHPTKHPKVKQRRKMGKLEEKIKMANKYMKRCSRKMQRKAAVRSDFILSH